MLRPNLAPFPRCGPSWRTTQCGQPRYSMRSLPPVGENLPNYWYFKSAPNCSSYCCLGMIFFFYRSCSCLGLWGFTWTKHSLVFTWRFLELVLQCRSLLSENLSHKFWRPQPSPIQKSVCVTTVPFASPSLHCNVGIATRQKAWVLVGLTSFVSFSWGLQS